MRKARGADRALAATSPQRGATKTWTRKQRADRLARMQAVVPAIVAGERVVDIAQRLGVAPSTVYDYLHDPAVAEELAQARAGAVENARLTLELSVGVAADTLIQVGQRGGKEDTARVKAAEAHLDRAGLVARRVVDVTHHDELSTMSDDELDAAFEADALAFARAQGWAPRAEIEAEMVGKGWRAPG